MNNPPINYLCIPTLNTVQYLHCRYVTPCSKRIKSTKNWHFSIKEIRRSMNMLIYGRSFCSAYDIQRVAWYVNFLLLSFLINCCLLLRKYTYWSYLSDLHLCWLDFYWDSVLESIKLSCIWFVKFSFITLQP